MHISQQGRFRDMYSDITAIAESEILLPPKRLGAVVCTAIIDGSMHAKSRAYACETCIACIEKAGLAAVGKRGVLSAAKLLSQETAKNRASALDLMEAILSKMNNEMHRLVRICGPNLTDKARQLLEERLAQPKEPSPATSWPLADHRSPSCSPVKSHRISDEHRYGSRDDHIFDELPKLSLRSWTKAVQNSSPRSREAAISSSDDPFAFSLSAFREPQSLPKNSAEDGGTEPVTAAEALPSGAAALLRARLLKIRGNTSMTEQNDKGVGSSDDLGKPLQSQQLVSPDTPVCTSDTTLTNFDAHLDVIRILWDKKIPVLDQDEDLTACIKTLKIFHAALARQQHASVGLSPEQLAVIRSSLLERIDNVVDILRRCVCRLVQACKCSTIVSHIPLSGSD